MSFCVLPSGNTPHPSPIDVTIPVRQDGCMDPAYALRDTSEIFTPALVFYKDLIRRNIARAVEIAGSPSRLRPHAKTHKTRETGRLELEAGETKHKRATP